MGAPGSDTRFLEWVIDNLRKSGRPTKVEAGKLAFDALHEYPERISDLNALTEQDGR